MRFDSIDALVRDMSQGQRVIAVFEDMERASHAFHEVCRKCDELDMPFKACKSNGRMRVESCDGSIRFTSERAQLRGCSCDVFYRDGGVTIRDWMGPLIMMATQAYGVEL
ncbi:MAG: hypothetical protein IKE55_03270 [Kiritimatiellae bacterium]|nr:hypothetical protein [Kiritimatiellia bacterium]